MNNDNLVIYDFKILYQILSEISDHINFKLTYINKITDLDLKTKDIKINPKSTTEKIEVITN